MLELDAALVLVVAEFVLLVAEPRRKTSLVLVRFAAPGHYGLTLEANGKDCVQRRVPDVAPLNESRDRAGVIGPRSVDLVVDEVLLPVEVEVVIDVDEQGVEIGVVHGVGSWRISRPMRKAFTSRRVSCLYALFRRWSTLLRTLIRGRFAFFMSDFFEPGEKQGDGNTDRSHD